MFDISAIRFDSQGLVPVIVQNFESGKVLMLGYMNESSLAETIEIKRVVFWSRSRNERWLKGETSGNFLHLIDIKRDCDSDAVLVQVRPQGPTCHTGNEACFEAHDD